MAEGVLVVAEVLGVNAIFQSGGYCYISSQSDKEEKFNIAMLTGWKDQFQVAILQRRVIEINQLKRSRPNLH